ncbi:unnamed protein product [Arabidopsis thaliana]|uniref:(thale cress) hypothetical protein n=1 Tax=Arabidopsis thaliana TaxID=3702 RepID=A0A7G2EA29_ARATH|nr:unnamed protein product [Arabidopsis thaliana]
MKETRSSGNVETENRAEGEDLVKNKAADVKKHLQMIGVQLLKNPMKQTEQRNVGRGHLV